MGLPGIFGTLLDLLLVILGFSLIIVIHELGHFLTARWAGVRVLAFAVGFGPALLSYRKGLGWRRGSSEVAVSKMDESARARLSPTEYRLNVLPLGGYVKMLGQDDADPTAVSSEPDSYMQAPVWKRMIIISGGVAANLVSAVLLFIVVFHLGLKAEPAVIGWVDQDGPAAKAVANTPGVPAGLKAGDRVVSVNGREPDSFNDLVAAPIMSGRDTPVRIDVLRKAVAGQATGGESGAAPTPLSFSVTPVIDEQSRMPTLGVMPIFSPNLLGAVNGKRIVKLDEQLAKVGFPELDSTMRLKSVGGSIATSFIDLERAMNESAGLPVAATFVSASGDEKSVSLKPAPRFMHASAMVTADKKLDFAHLSGLTPVLSVSRVIEGKAAELAGLKPGDLFVQVGGSEFPSYVDTIRELKASAGRSVKIVVARASAGGVLEEFDAGMVPVTSEGTLGFEFETNPHSARYLTRWSGAVHAPGAAEPSAAALAIPIGGRLDRVNDQPVASLGEAREVIIKLLDDSSAGSGLTVRLGITRVLGPDAGRTVEVPWSITLDEARAIASLGYASPIPMEFFAQEKTLIKAASVPGAITKGVKETHRVMMMTYTTFARLFDGTVRVEHLKGPVGIAHVGVIIADRGMVWMLFFMALISVNLSVINFLPLPIVDGGHMVYLIYEQITGRPPPVQFQNAAALVGLVFIGAMFLLVTTYNVIDVVKDIIN